MLIRLFKSAGSTGHVFLLKNGRIRNKGLAYSGLIGPTTTVAVVPTTPQILNFTVEGQTTDKQGVVVRGSVPATFIPQTAISKFDFTVDPKGGAYLGEWQQALNAVVVEHVLRAVLAKVRNLNVEESTRSQKELEEAVTKALRDGKLAELGIKVDSCSIPKIDPRDEEIRKAIGADERQTMLTEADAALHARRLKAAGNERVVQTYEVETALKLEEERGKLLDEQAKNLETQANADAKATEIRLKPLQEVEPGRLLGAALMKMADAGVDNLSIVPEMFAAMNGHVRS